MTISFKNVRVLVIFLTLAALPVMSQVTGRLSGTVLDPDGKPVSGARVILNMADSTVEDSFTLTDSNGSFLFPSLRPTYYDLVVEFPNFKKAGQKGVKIDPLTETPLAALKLELGPKDDDAANEERIALTGARAERDRIDPA